MLFEWDLGSEKFGSLYVYCFQQSALDMKKYYLEGKWCLLNTYYVPGIMQGNLCTVI